MLVLGVDPGTRFMGYGLIRFENRVRRVGDYGVIKIDTALELPQRLLVIHQALDEIIRQSQPDAVVVEEIFVNQNAKSTLKLGQARGVILLAAAQAHIPIAEYAPRQIKQAVTGRGNASKEQIRWMMGQLLKLDMHTLKEDAADALAAALCHGMRHRCA